MQDSFGGVNEKSGMCQISSETWALPLCFCTCRTDVCGHDIVVAAAAPHEVAVNLLSVCGRCVCERNYFEKWDD